jgi:SpoIID/LytB domain protein
LEYQLDDGSKKSFKLHNEYDIRKMLHPSFLFSSSFIPNVSETQIEFKGAGWGHGVGMCQIGALGMALNGYSADKILSHYFQNSSMKKLY